MSFKTLVINSKNIQIMKRIFYHAAILLTLVAGGACNKTDNYPAPSCTITGSTIDEGTGNTVQTEQGSNGTRVKLLETSYSSTPVPEYFQSRQEGTFNDTRIFAATYKVSVEGPFVPIVQTNNQGNIISDSSQTITLTNTATLHFNVQPFLRIKWVGSPVINPDTSVTVQFIVTRGTNNPAFQLNVSDINLYVSNTQYDGSYNYDQRYSRLVSYSGSNGTKLLGQVITMTTQGGSLKAQDIYFRIGARVKYGSNYYNYSTPVSITFP
jgi:hypothetical protein